jgi:hypothetical protein
VVQYRVDCIFNNCLESECGKKQSSAESETLNQLLIAFRAASFQALDSFEQIAILL